MENEDFLVLERLVDKYGLGVVLVGLADVCQGKAEHVEENWQDLSLAKAWGRCAGKLDKLAANMVEP